LPKVEVHLHLEGAIPLDALWELCLKYGPDPSVTDLSALKRRFEYRDFPHFIETWIWKNGYLREYEDFTLIAEKFAGHLAAQNVAYAEVFYSPPDFARHGLKTQEITQAVRKGLSRVAGIEVALIVDLVRDLGPDRAAITLEEAREVMDLGVVGVGLGGSEQAFPPGVFARVYERARRHGFRTTAHAGEAAGPASIWSALRDLGVDRIGHGTRACEDERLLDFLAEKKVPLEMCPISNVCTGVVPRVEDHPIRQYFDRGLLVTVNTDDPGMFGNSLADEYGTLAEVFGFSREEVRTIAANGVRASWMAEEKKADMIERIMKADMD
jgi:adenosine deaminase